MKKAWFQICFVLALIASPVVSMGQSLSLGNFFTKSEQVTINKIIDYYDSIVMTRTHNKYDIKNAYYHYFDSIFPVVIKTGNLSLATVTGEKRAQFLSSLNQNALKEIYTIHNSVTHNFNGKTKTIYSPYILGFNSKGAYAQMLESLSNENDLLNRYYTRLMSSGNFGPGNFAIILNEYNKFDFGDRLQRLLVIVNMLVIN